ncbi:hypothetical protein M3Y99_00290000 [Aphelenchoides fujianensis]|nr:hypothetical protein M3Y99_00290000 [Aphelenchoides fujianensis]
MEFSIYDPLQERQVHRRNASKIAVDGYLGLAPGKGNLIVQLFAQRLIPAPIAAFSAAGESFLKVGGLPTECEQWAFHSTLTNSWVFRAERVEVFGFVFRNQTIQMDFLNDARFYVPDEVVGSMLASGVLAQGSEVQGDVQYYIDCNETFELSAEVDGQRFLIDLKWLPWPEKCLTILLRRF